MTTPEKKLNVNHLYEAIIEQAPDAVFILDAELNFISVSKLGCELLGYSREELLMLRLFDIDQSLDFKNFPSFIDMIREKGAMKVERLGTHKDGTPIPLEINASVIQAEGTQFFLVFARDISDRKRVEESLIAEKVLMDSMMDNLPDSIFFKDRECRLIKVSRTLMESLGFQEMDQILGKTDIDLFGREFGEQTMQVDRQVMETGEPSIGLVEKRLLNNGEYNWTLTSKVPLRDKSGNIVGLVGLAREINELKRREEELRIKENQLSVASEIAGLGYWEYNVDEEFFTFNDHFYRVFHTTVEEVGSYKIKPAEYAKRFLHPDDQYIIAQEMEKALNTPDPNYSRQLEHRIIYPNGDQGYIAVRFFIVKDEYGRTIKTFGANQNITDRKQAEKELTQYRDHLEQLVQKRTEQLENINKQLEAFAYSISHDLRGPLRHINGFANLLRRKLDPVPEDADHYLHLINEASKRMGTMIDGLLHFSRLGRQKLEQETVDLNHLISEILKEVEPELKDRQIEWKIGELPTITGDHNLLKIAVANIILNAIKYTRGQDNAVIEIARCVRSTWKNCTIFIKDNGVGFDMHYIDKLFGVFQRLHKEEEFEGTGIGLANAQQIIKKHGGVITAEGMPGKGATFYITI